MKYGCHSSAWKDAAGEQRLPGHPVLHPETLSQKKTGRKDYANIIRHKMLKIIVPKKRNNVTYWKTIIGESRQTTWMQRVLSTL